MATTTNLSSLVINYLTQAQYDAAAQAGTLNENQIYLTPASAGTGITVDDAGSAVDPNPINADQLQGHAGSYYAPIASPSFTGAPTVVAGTDYSTAKLRNIILSTSDPTGASGSNGDVWIVYDSSSGVGVAVETKTVTPSSASASISFTGLSAEPLFFTVTTSSNLSTGASPYKTAVVASDGTTTAGVYITNTSNAQSTYSAEAFSATYSSGTLTITGSNSQFQTNEYKLVSIYGSGTVSSKSTSVNSGVTAVTFTGFTAEPEYFTCLFTSNIGTASGYTRVQAVVFDGTNLYGLEMGSNCKATSNWTKSYSNGSLTITSSSTSSGGYFHQPGNYVLIYI